MSGRILPVLPHGQPWGIIAGPNHLRKEDCARMSECLAQVATLRGNGRCPESCPGYDKQTMHAVGWSGISQIALAEEYEHDVEYHSGDAEMSRTASPAVKECVRCHRELPLTKEFYQIILNRQTMRPFRSEVCRECFASQLWEGRAA